MTAVVSDTSPINYLCLIGAVGILPSLFEDLILPPTVLSELRHPRAPKLVAEWVNALPAWVRVQTPTSLLAGLGLDGGDTEAISLALELKLPAILIDEMDGRLVAADRGLETIGTLAIIRAAGRLRLLDAEEAFLRLRATNFHADAKRFDELIAEARAAKND